MSRQKLAAFSLIELVVALVVVMTLVALALPRLRIFIARGRQAEAIHNLGVIHKLLRSHQVGAQSVASTSGLRNYLADRGLYVRFGPMGNGTHTNNCTDSKKKNEIGFRVEDCDALRYNYQNRTVFLIWGTMRLDAINNGRGQLLIYPGCRNKIDRWNMTKEGKLEHGANVIRDCTN